MRSSAFVGQITLRVVGRLMGLLLAAVQFPINGLRSALPFVMAAL